MTNAEWRMGKRGVHGVVQTAAGRLENESPAELGSRAGDGIKLEARAGIEPAVELLQSSALPLGDRAVRLTGGGSC